MNIETQPIKTIGKGLVLLTLLIMVGTAGFMIIERFSLLDSLYMTVITLSTVGFGEVKPLSPMGRIYTIILILAGVGSVTYFVSKVFQALLEGELKLFFGRRLNRELKKMKDHYIVCGCGRIGFLVALELKRARKKVIVIDNNPKAVEKLEDEDIPYIIGDAQEEETLIKAGIEKAKGLITTLPQDAENVFTILTARELNKNIFILARAIDESSEKKLKRAGATKVIKPYLLGGIRMAQAILRPNVIDFIEIAMVGNIDLLMEEIEITEDMGFHGKTIIECNFRREYGILIIAIKKKDGRFIFNPSSAEVLEVGDTLIVMGNKKDLQRFA